MSVQPPSSPEAWFKLSPLDIENLTTTTSNSSNSHWPFVHVQIPQFYELLDELRNLKLYAADGVLNIYASLLAGCSLAVTVLLMVTLYRKAIVERSGFYRAMLLIASLDLAYCTCDMIYNIFYRRFKMYGGTNYSIMWTLIVLRGCVYSFSLASDMCTVVLTLERYLAVTKPQLHKVLSEKKRIFAPLIGLFVLCISLTRMHYSMEKTVVRKGELYYYASSTLGMTPAVVGLATFSDVLLPIVLLFSMTILSTLFLVSVLQRRRNRNRAKSQVVVQAVTSITVTRHRGSVFAPGLQAPAVAWANNEVSGLQPQQNGPTVAWTTESKKSIPKVATNNNNEMKSMVALTLALDGLFIMNQLGYCMYYVVQVAARSIDFGSTYKELWLWVLLNNKLSNYVDIESCLGEILSHGLNFPLYLALSRSIRKEFVHVYRKYVC